MSRRKGFLWTDVFGLRRLCEFEALLKPANAWLYADGSLTVEACRLIVIPLSFLRRLDSLRYTSVIALISIGYLVILVVAHFIMKDTMQERGDIRVFKWAGPVPTVASFPVMVFAYTCHQNVRRLTLAGYLRYRTRF